MKLSPPTRPSEPVTASAGGLGAEEMRGVSGVRRPPRRRFGAAHWYALLVLLPTLVVGAYYVFYAADIYESEARFVLRSRGGGSGGSGAEGGAAGGRVGALLGAAVSARPGADEARAVVAYLDSHAAVLAMRRDLDLVTIWRRPEADAIAKLWWSNPEVEWLLWYFRRRVTVGFEPETMVLTLRAKAFRPDDAVQLGRRALRAAEDLVNAFAERMITDTTRAAEEVVQKAEARVTAAREAMTAFREREQAFDPQRTATGAVDNIGRLEATLAQTRADLQERRSFMRPDNPQIQVLQNRITALQSQIATERSRVTRGEEALTQQVAGFERLVLEREFADRQLTSAIASLEDARNEALRQQVFLLRVAEPHSPEWPLYPKATFNTLTIFVSLTVLFGIGWMLVVSAREHAN